jgi:hypothetical protein
MPAAGVPSNGVSGCASQQSGQLRARIASASRAGKPPTAQAGAAAAASAAAAVTTA